MRFARNERVVNARPARIWFRRYPIFFPTSRGLRLVLFFFFFISLSLSFLFFFICSFSLFPHARCVLENEYRRTWKTHCIDTPLFGLMRDKLGRCTRASWRARHRHRHRGRGKRGWNCNFSNCMLLSSVCNTFRDSWRSPYRWYLISIDWVLSPLEILKTFSFAAPACLRKLNTPSLPLTGAAGLKSGSHSPVIYFNVLTFRYYCSRSLRHSLVSPLPLPGSVVLFRSRIVTHRLPRVL